MPIVSFEVLDALHQSITEVAREQFASVDWFLSQAVMEKLERVRTEAAAPPRLVATAHRIAGAILLTPDLFASLRWRDKNGVAAPENAVLGHHLYFKDAIRKISDDESDKILGNALMKALSQSTRDTAACGYDEVDKGAGLLCQALGVRSKRAAWPCSERVEVVLEQAIDAFGSEVPRRLTLSPLVKTTQDTWLARN